MRLKYITKKAINDLMDQIETNIDVYYDGRANELLDNISPGQIRELDLECDVINFNSNPGPKTDSQDALSIFNSLKGLTPSEASNDGIWVYLSHKYGEYVYKRSLEGNKKKSLDLVKTRFFINDRGKKSRQSIRGLWFPAYRVKCALEKSGNFIDLNTALELLYEKADIPHRVFEFPNILGNSNILSSIIYALKEENEKFSQIFSKTNDKEEKEVYQEVCRSLNRINVVRPLGILEQDELNQLVVGEVNRIHSLLSA